MDEIHEETGKFPDLTDIEINDVPGINGKIINVVLDASHFGTSYKAIRLDIWEQLQEELKQLRHHRDTTVGLWATDQNYKATINKACFDGVKPIHWFEDQEEFTSIGLEVIKAIEEEFKKVTFQIK